MGTTPLPLSFHHRLYVRLFLLIPQQFNTCFLQSASDFEERGATYKTFLVHRGRKTSGGKNY